MDLGVITGSSYNVNPKALGYSTCTFIGVNLDRGAMYRDVVPELEKIPEIVECHFTTGPSTEVTAPRPSSRSTTRYTAKFPSTTTDHSDRRNIAGCGEPRSRFICITLP